MLQRKYTARQYKLYNHIKLKVNIPHQYTVVKKNNSLFIFAISLTTVNLLSYFLAYTYVIEKSTTGGYIVSPPNIPKEDLVGLSMKT